MADRRRVRWDEAVLSHNPRRCHTSSYGKPLPSPYPPTDDVTNVYDDSTDTDDTLTDADDTLIGKGGDLTNSDDTLNYMNDASTDTDGALVNTDHTLSNTDDILIDKNSTLSNSTDDLTDTDDTLLGKDGPLTDTNDALSKTDDGSMTMKFILSFDGGGIRGYSTLTILQALMDEIEEIERADSTKAPSSISASVPRSLDDELRAVPNVLNPASVPISERLPLHYFDYIGGTGSGNVIAMMLAEGKMSVAEVTDAYRDMCAPGGNRRLVNKKVVFSKRDKASKWLHKHSLKPILAWTSPNKHQESAIPTRKADPLYNNNNHNPSRTLLEKAHFPLLDDPSAKNGIYLLSIGSAITDPIDRRANQSIAIPTEQANPNNPQRTVVPDQSPKSALSTIQPETLRPAGRPRRYRPRSYQRG